MKLKFRKPGKQDLKALCEIMLVISDKRADPERTGELIERINNDPRKYLLVAEDAETGELCGSLLGVVFEDICDDGRPILLVENVAVLEKFQGKGVGKSMFREIEQWGKSMDCHYEMLVSGNQRTGAHKFYRAVGFEECKGFKKFF